MTVQDKPERKGPRVEPRKDAGAHQGMWLHEDSACMAAENQTRLKVGTSQDSIRSQVRTLQFHVEKTEQKFQAGRFSTRMEKVDIRQVYIRKG